MKDRRKRLKLHKQCFVGSDAVACLVECGGGVRTIEEAVAIGNSLIDLELIRLVGSSSSSSSSSSFSLNGDGYSSSTLFKNDGSWYQFVKTEDMLSPTSNMRKVFDKQQEGFAPELVFHAGSGSLEINSEDVGPQPDTFESPHGSRLELLRTLSSSLSISPLANEKEQERSKEYLSDVVHRCVHTCLEMVKILDNFEGLRELHLFFSPFLFSFSFFSLLTLLLPSLFLFPFFFPPLVSPFFRSSRWCWMWERPFHACWWCLSAS